MCDHVTTNIGCHLSKLDWVFKWWRVIADSRWIMSERLGSVVASDNDNGHNTVLILLLDIL